METGSWADGCPAALATEPETKQETVSRAGGGLSRVSRTLQGVKSGAENKVAR